MDKEFVIKYHMKPKYGGWTKYTILEPVSLELNLIAWDVLRQMAMYPSFIILKYGTIEQLYPGTYDTQSKNAFKHLVSLLVKHRDDVIRFEEVW